MGVSIAWNEQLLLKFTNSLFGRWHEALIEILTEKDIELDAHLQLLILNMDQDIWGMGVPCPDLARYLKTKENALLFADLIKQLVNKMRDSEQPGSVLGYTHLYEAVLHYAPQLACEPSITYIDMIIECNKQLLLKLNRDVFNKWYQSIISIVKEQKVELDDELKNFLWKIGQDLHDGTLVRIDLADYFTMQESARLFAHLIDAALKKVQGSDQPFESGLESLLYLFYKAVYRYSSYLPEKLES